MPHDIEIDPKVIQLMPESLARENLVFPLGESSSGLLVAAAVPVESETIEKLRFILSNEVFFVPTSTDWVVEQLNRHYGSDDDTNFLEQVF